MRLPIVFTPAAKDEFDDAHIRYETSRKGLGRRFRTAVRDCLRYVQRFPLTKQIVHPPDVRRALVVGFPFLVVYRVTSDSIRILSVFHTSRDPTVWQRRADEDSPEAE